MYTVSGELADGRTFRANLPSPNFVHAVETAVEVVKKELDKAAGTVTRFSIRYKDAKSGFTVKAKSDKPKAPRKKKS